MRALGGFAAGAGAGNEAVVVLGPVQAGAVVRRVDIVGGAAAAGAESEYRVALTFTVPMADTLAEAAGGESMLGAFGGGLAISGQVAISLPRNIWSSFGVDYDVETAGYVCVIVQGPVVAVAGAVSVIVEEPLTEAEVAAAAKGGVKLGPMRARGERPLSGIGRHVPQAAHQVYRAQQGVPL